MLCGLVAWLLLGEEQQASVVVDKRARRRDARLSVTGTFKGEEVGMLGERQTNQQACLREQINKSERMHAAKKT